MISEHSRRDRFRHLQLKYKRLAMPFAYTRNLETCLLRRSSDLGHGH
jgi:hypothetical protein